MFLFTVLGSEREVEFGKTVEGAEEDAMCVICQATPVNPVKVRNNVAHSSNPITFGFLFPISERFEPPLPTRIR